TLRWKLAKKLCTSLEFSETVKGGSETRFVSSNLKNIMDLMLDHADKVIKDELTSAACVLPTDQVVLCTSASPEHTIYWQHTAAKLIGLIGTEAKGVDASLGYCQPQLLAACSAFGTQ